MSAINAVLTKTYSVLNGDATLLALATGGVYDKIPEVTAFPYIRIGEAVETPWNCFGRKGKDVVLTIHIYDSDSDVRWGFKKCIDILVRMNTLFDYPSSFTVSGYATTVYCRYDGGESLLDADGVSRHVVARYRVIVQV